jgi:hypothetical protein
MLLTIAFWLLILIDVAALLLVFVLGLAAGPSSQTSPLAIAAFLLVLPGVLILAAIALFHFTASPVTRSIAFLAAAAPLLLAIAAPFYAKYNLNQYKDPSGKITNFKSAAMQDLEAAIRRNDAAAVAALAPKANLKETALDGTTVLTIALLHIQKNPAKPDVLRALLVAGVDPNTTDEFGTPIWFRATAPSTPPEVLPLFLEFKANLNATNRQNHNALFDAVNGQNWSAVAFLIQRGIDWRSYRDLQGRDLPTRLQSDAEQPFGNKAGLPELRASLHPQRQ